MSITTELREWFDTCKIHWFGRRPEIEPMLDRIDAEHDELLKNAYEDIASDEFLEGHGWVKLPVDADGVPIRVGDRLTDSAEHKSEGISESLMLESTGWYVNFGSGWANERIHEWHHYTPPTVEDVLREFADEVRRCCDTADTIAEYAAKLRLAGDDE